MPEVFLLAAAKPNSTLGDLIVVTLSFLILLLALKKFAWSSISEIMNKRADKIANDLDNAEKSRNEAEKLAAKRQEQLMNSRSEAADIIKNAKDSGEQSRQNILRETQLEVSRLKEKAQADISQEREHTMNAIKDDVALLSIQIAEKILNKEISTETHEALINQYIEGLSANHETK
ncbi:MULTISPECIES: F0F1 ATP synthase subunit B [Enterococcus]|uniref:F0F1 ATP synthase subunit B n=1 Tax=Enterococcus TaxID=1350 RepID=UPI000DEB338F|nr:MULTISPECIES: F0F1 ATP synthase subunit B [Enterococcus]MDK2844068.1 F-type H+-transporting ATPase subunit b [Enterococcus sp.]NLL32620.1 F0F1 ATP synthase subunit B [Enterococcus cecorum]RBR32082.1 ATP synthase F0, B subunit [Enterococcus cecorum]RBR32114.1 ATP synthase F0, B subunit [Enterococcus cecorum]RBR36370.1 ATP synthase F0, B subunit [Enterococcus cecorum]